MTSPSSSADQLRIAASLPAHETLAQALRRQILLGAFPVGSRLPTERDLAPALGVSRNTARQAIKILADQGLVHTTLGRNGGSIVTDPPVPARSRRALLTRWRATMQDVLAVRLAAEPLAARWAAERGTTSQRRSISKSAAANALNSEAYAELEGRWHLQVAAAGHCELLSDTITRCHEDAFSEASSLWIRSALGLPSERWSIPLATVMAAHTEIGDQILRQDAAGAEQSMREHIKASGEQMSRVFDEVLS